MLKKAVATVIDFAKGSLGSEVADWTSLTEWAKRNPARWIYGIVGIWLSLYFLLSYKSNTAEFISEHGPLKTSGVIVDLFFTIWLMACMFSFFSQRSGAKWFRRSLVVLSIWSWLLNLWDAGMIGIVWIVPALLLFLAVERGVATLDETSRRIRWVKYVLFTIALSSLQTSLLVAFLLDDGAPFWFWQFCAFLWCFTALLMWMTYQDRSDHRGGVIFSSAGLGIISIVIVTYAALSEMVEIAVGIPVGWRNRSLWIQETLGVSGHWAELMNSGMTLGLLAAGFVTALLGITLYRYLRRRFRGFTIHAAS